MDQLMDMFKEINRKYMALTQRNRRKLTFRQRNRNEFDIDENQMYLRLPKGTIKNKNG